MSYRYWNSDEQTGGHVRPRTTANEARDDMLSPPWFRERRQPRTDRTINYEPVPSLVGPEYEGGPNGIWYAEYATVERDDAEQEAHLRTQKSNELLVYRTAARSVDVEEAGRQVDLASRAFDQELNLYKATTLAEVEAIGTDEASLPPATDAYVAEIQAMQAKTLIAEDDARIQANSNKALSGSDRAELVAWAKTVDEGIPADAPPSQYLKVRVPDADSGEMLITRVWLDTGKYENWHAWYWKATCRTENINALAVSSYDQNGITQGNYAFQATSDPLVWETYLQEGRGNAAKVDYSFDILRGAASKSGRVYMPAADDSLSFVVRW